MFKFHTKPFKHQKEIFELSKDLPEYAYFWEMGAGKTKPTIDTISYLFQSSQINAALIFANKGSYKNWITKEIPKHMSPEVSLFATYWDASQKKKLQFQHMRLFKRKVYPDTPELKIFLMNVEALAYKEPFELALKFLKAHPNNLMCIDESTTIKNHKAKRTKSAMKLAEHTKYRRILTGSPITNSPLDIYSQAKVLNKTFLRCTSYFAFRARYAKMVDVKMGPRSFKKVVGYQNLDELSRNIKPWSSRITKKECLDLPKKIYTKVHVQLTPEQKRMYDELSKDLVTQIKSGAIVSTELAITKLLRLHTITCGHLKDDDGKIHTFKNDRLTALENLLEETSGKVIIWARWIEDIKNIQKLLEKKYPGEYMTYYGASTTQERELAIEGIQNSTARFLIANGTAAYGITLTAVTTNIYYSNTIRLEERLQSEDRSHRIGQDHPVTYCDIVCDNTVDEKIIKALRQKKNIASEILGDDITNWI